MKLPEIPDSNRLHKYFIEAENRFYSTGYSVRQHAQAYAEAYAAGFTSAFFDSPELPVWAREWGAAAKSDFLAESPTPYFDTSAAYLADPLRATPTQDRAINWVFGQRLLGPQAYQYFQDYGSCVYSSKTKAVAQILGTRILAQQQPETLTDLISVAWYANRGHCGEGSTLGLAARLYTQGIPFRRNYLEGKYDLREEDKDEYLAQTKWCRTGLPSDLKEQFTSHKLGSISYMRDVSFDRVRDVFLAGGVIDTGSTATVAGTCDPVSTSTKRIGGHDQVFGGFDNSIEFRDWYKQTTGKVITEPVIMMHQTWGNNWIKLTNWPTHLWGERPEGMIAITWSAARPIFDEVYAWYPEATVPRPASPWSTV